MSLETKGQVLHRVRAHWKVPDWLSDLNAILTRKLSMFLSRLNEITTTTTTYFKSGNEVLRDVRFFNLIK